jgi:hypothetical protein
VIPGGLSPVSDKSRRGGLKQIGGGIGYEKIDGNGNCGGNVAGDRGRRGIRKNRTKERCPGGKDCHGQKGKEGEEGPGEKSPGEKGKKGKESKKVSLKI